MVEVRGQKSEVRGQLKTEVRGQKSEIRGQLKTEVGDQRSEISKNQRQNQKSKVRGQ